MHTRRAWPGVRGTIAPSCLAGLLSAAACTAPPPEPYELPPSAVDEESAFEYRRVPEAPEPPDPPPDFVGQNPGCPDLMVFADADSLCAHGIMPDKPHGACHRMLETDANPEGFYSWMRADRVEVEALGGHVELFVHHDVSPSLNFHDHLFLALRGANGYVLLSEFYVNGYDADEPKLRWVQDSTSVELVLRQKYYKRDIDDWAVRQGSMGCTRDEAGGIRCDGECPSLALDEPLPELDCSEFSEFDWSGLPRGKLAKDGDSWELDYDQTYYAAKFLGLDSDEYDEPEVVRDFPLEDCVLKVVTLDRKRWALIHVDVPLLASDREIRVGPAPGGTYVSSWSAGQRRIHRLDLHTHGLEPVIPGACQDD